MSSWCLTELLALSIYTKFIEEMYITSLRYDYFIIRRYKCFWKEGKKRGEVGRAGREEDVGKLVDIIV